MNDRNKVQFAMGSTAIGRRATIRGLALGGLAAFAGVAVSAPAEADNLQPGWRRCSKCQAMFYAGSGMGVCPAGGAHSVLGSRHYVERIGGDVANVQQGGWSWCTQCQGFFYSRASGGMGHCPAGGAHVKTGSSTYAAVIGEDGPHQQAGWRWCSKCMVMFYARSPGTMGVCPVGGAHSDAASGHYASILGA